MKSQIVDTIHQAFSLRIVNTVNQKCLSHSINVTRDSEASEHTEWKDFWNHSSQIR